MRSLEKVLRYKDLRMLWGIFITSLKISFFSFIKGPHHAIISMPSVNTEIVKKYDRNEISRYVNLCIFIRRKLGNNILNAIPAYLTAKSCLRCRQFGDR